jgi:ABC-2 type transport system ATP-binding protein
VSEPIIAASGLTRRFGAFTAVDDVRLAVEPGTLFAFLGANGSGKSTTIRMLIGLLAPTAGSIRVDGVDVCAEPRRVRDRIGYMGQKVSLYQGITLRENVEFYAGLYGLAGDTLGRRWDAVRERFGLGAAEEERPESLPAGIRQRAGLALATLHEPRLLFLDEPTAGVDVASRDLFWQIIQDAAESGVTVFVTTHFLEEVDYCDRVSCLADGRLVVSDATPEELRAAHGSGYRIALAADPGPAARAALARAGFAIASGSGGDIELRRPSLDGAALDALRAALGPTAAGGVRVRQPAMQEVFQHLIAGAAAARSVAAEVGAPARAAAAPEPAA